MRAFLVLSFLVFSACTRSVVLAPSPLGKIFPSVQGQSLDGKVVRIPESLTGAYTLLLVGFEQRAQFDIDRWILGALQAELPVGIVEIPTIAGMMPRVVQQFIDNGMRSGIPKEDWASVVTVYKDAGKIIEAIGNEHPNNAHVLLLDSGGRVLWSADRGYSASQVLELKRIIMTSGTSDDSVGQSLKRSLSPP